jgi:hypothetical protein
MRKTIVIAAIGCVLLLSVVSLKIHYVHAQSINPWQVSVVGAHTLRTVTVATTQYCFASDGLWMSLNGAAYVQLGAVGPQGPVGPIGLTGPPGPIGVSSVTSVNGKTGAVILGATTTVQ